MITNIIIVVKYRQWRHRALFLFALLFTMFDMLYSIKFEPSSFDESDDSDEGPPSATSLQ